MNVVGCFLLLVSAPVGQVQTPVAVTPVARNIVIPHAATAPSLEDYLDGTPRPDEAVITTFVQREPDDGVPASQPTEAYLLRQRRDRSDVTGSRASH